MGPKAKVFAQKSTVVKWNCCIMWIDIEWGLHKLGLILEIKVVQKLSLEKNGFNKKWSPKLIFLDYKIDFESTISTLFDKPYFIAGFKKNPLRMLILGQ